MVVASHTTIVRPALRGGHHGAGPQKSGRIAPPTPTAAALRLLYNLVAPSDPRTAAPAASSMRWSERPEDMLPQDTRAAGSINESTTWSSDFASSCASRFLGSWVLGCC